MYFYAPCIDKSGLKSLHISDKHYREKLAEHGVRDPSEGGAALVGEISPEDLGELMGDEQSAPDSHSDVPAGMSLEESEPRDDEVDFSDGDLDEDED